MPEDINVTDTAEPSTDPQPQQPTSAVPYDRFKQVNEEKKAAQEELRKLKEQQRAADEASKKAAEADKSELQKLQEQLGSMQKEQQEKAQKQQEKLIKSLIRNAATEAGLNDVNDAFNFLDFGALEYDDSTDTLTGLPEKLAELKSAKPYLFRTDKAPAQGANPGGNTGGSPDPERIRKDLYNRAASTGDSLAFDSLVSRSVDQLFKR